MNIKSYYATVWMIEVNEGVASLLFNSDISYDEAVLATA